MGVNAQTINLMTKIGIITNMIIPDGRLRIGRQIITALIEE